MKKKISLFLLFCCCIFLCQCQTDELVIKARNAAIVRNISYEEFTSYRSASEKLETVRKHKPIDGMQQRLVYDPVLDFYIDIDNIIATSKDGFSSFTFAVSRDIPKIL